MTLLESKNVTLGSSASDFSLQGVDDKSYLLADFDEYAVIVIVFMCNHCPYVQAVWKRLVGLQERFLDRGVRFVGINPNFHPDYPEETMENMKKYHDSYNMNFPYLLDESQEVAKAYGAVCTPDIFVYDESRELAYHGRIDDSWKDESNVSKQDLADALERLLAGENPDADQKPSTGCSIKWRE
ncbi:MAG: thioredoxin family protein [Candidatus Peregrinibacteria bacterium]